MKEKIAILSILANIFLAIGKITVGVFSNSAAILAAGIDSFVDIFSSTIGYIGIKVSNKPADKEHPYGHYKFEVLSGVLITFIIFITGLGVIYDACIGLSNPINIKIDYLTFGVMIISVTVNEIMSRLKIHHGKKEGSVSLLSDGSNSRMDAYTSIMVLLGLFFTKYWIYTDSVLAILMGLYIVKEAFSIGKEAIGSLLDVSAGEEAEKQIKDIIKDKKIKVNSLKTQKKGSVITANIEIDLPSNLKLEEATKISNSLREEIMRKVGNISYIAIQIESHYLKTSFYKPEFGKGFGWQRKGVFVGKPGEDGKGPSGYCICSKCGYEIAHQSGVPCSKLECPKCGINLKRK
uniref:Cation transporter n=1 Tax=candidate division CPR3 bacterium TaxID=2268181 RepID=A0A7C4M222_UNCC3